MGAAVLWTLANVTIQPASRRFGAVGALVWAQVLGCLMVLPFAFGFEGLPDFGSTSIASVVGGGAAALLAYTALFEALRMGQLALVIPVTSLWVVISTIIGVSVLGNTLSAWATLGVVAVVIGNIVVTRYGSDAKGGTLGTAEGRGTPRLALLWAAASGVGFGFMVPMVDVLGEDVGRLWALPTLWGTELLLGLPVWYVMKALPRAPRGWAEWSLAGRVGLFEILGFVSLTIGLALGSVAAVSPASSVGTALAVLWGMLVLKERPPRPAVAGAVVAAAGVFLAAL